MVNGSTKDIVTKPCDNLISIQHKSDPYKKTYSIRVLGSYTHTASRCKITCSKKQGKSNQQIKGDKI